MLKFISRYAHVRICRLKQVLTLCDHRANPGGAEPVPDSSLIYFAKTSEASYLPPIPGTTSGAGNVGFNENATLPFTPGKTYRLRFINTSGFAYVSFRRVLELC
jgi:hypothetical protein